MENKLKKILALLEKTQKRIVYTLENITMEEALLDIMLGITTRPRVIEIMKSIFFELSGEDLGDEAGVWLCSEQTDGEYGLVKGTYILELLNTGNDRGIDLPKLINVFDPMQCCDAVTQAGFAGIRSL